MWWLIVGAVAFFLVGDGDPLDALMTLVNEIQRGKRATHAKYGEDGVVRASPDELADEAGVDVDTYALARMISSEEGNSSNLVKMAVAWSAVNYASRHGRRISSILLNAVNDAHDGFFGTQKDIDPASPNKGKSDRYASTALDPYEGDLEIARGVLDNTLPDPTGGAQQFDRPSGESDPEAVAAKRVNSGAELVMVPGIDDLRFWRT